MEEFIRILLRIFYGGTKAEKQPEDQRMNPPPAIRKQYIEESSGEEEKRLNLHSKHCMIPSLRTKFLKPTKLGNLSMQKYHEGGKEIPYIQLGRLGGFNLRFERVRSSVHASSKRLPAAGVVKI
ncbi:hypothetical protein OSTOST_02629 [Ostertagia ostertagi]